MATDRQIDAVVEVLTSTPLEGERTAGEMAALVCAALESLRRREYKYVIIAQERSRPLENGRSFHPTWVKGPFYTAAEAGLAARLERKAMGPDVRVMGAQVFGPEEVPIPSELREVLA